MTTDKPGIRHLAEILYQKGIEHVVISPGSRNAPLIIAFNRHTKINCISIVDERSAAFFALGIAQQTNKAVGIISTSGTAVLNYAPAIAEAYYQQIPLIILTADRPPEWIDQGVGQAIRQNNIYSNFIKGSFELPVEPKNDEELRLSDRLINEAVNLATYGTHGPVHINIPLREPLYNLIGESKLSVKLIKQPELSSKLKYVDLKVFSEKWKKYNKRMILCGSLKPDNELNNVINNLAQDKNTVILTETISNLHAKGIFTCIDKLVTAIKPNETKDFKPELLITIGENIISKMIKAFLRNNKATEHWHIDISGKSIDTFQSLTEVISLSPKVFLGQIPQKNTSTEGSYWDLWKQKEIICENKHQTFIKNIEFSDLKLYDKLLSLIPENSNLQLGNSTVVRYAQLFKPKKNFTYNSNRGTSGIDGCSSTAAGAAFVSKKPTTLITGDISFLYDSNALWNNHLSDNLRIIVINNSGGNIFRFLDGSSSIAELEEFFVTEPKVDYKKLVEAHGIQHYYCDNMADLEQIVSRFYSETHTMSVLEIKTPSEKSAEILKAYFSNLKST